MKNVFSLLIIISPVITFSLFEFDRAISWQEVGDWKASLSLLEKVLIDYPNNPAYLYHTGLAHYKLENFEFAQNYFAKFLNVVDSHNTQTRIKGFFNQGNALYKCNKFEEAINAYNNALLLDPQNNYVITNKKLAEEMLAKKNSQQSEQPRDDSQRNSGDKNGSKDENTDKDSQSQPNNQPKPQNSKDSSSNNQESKTSPQKSTGQDQGSDPGEQQDRQGDANSDRNQNPADKPGASDLEKKQQNKAGGQSNEVQSEQSEQKNDLNAPDNLAGGNSANPDSFQNDLQSKKENNREPGRESHYNQQEPRKMTNVDSVDKEKNQERIKKLEELEQASAQLIGEQELVRLLKAQEMQDQKDNKALMRALVKSKNAQKTEENGW